MRQAFHILKKDARFLRLEISLLCVLSMFYGWAATRMANSIPIQVVLGIAAAYVIACLVHAETIPGNQQFWVTRPYRRSSLMVAKLLGLLLFVNLPILAARLYVLGRSNFPLTDAVGALMWSQLLLFLGGMLPVAALAAVTSGLVPFLFTVLVLVAVVLGVDASIAPPSASAVRLTLSASQWVWNSIVVLTLVSLSVPVLLLQYRARRTWLSRWVIGCVVLGGIAAYVYVPWPVAAAVQSRLSPRRYPEGAVELRMEPEARRFFERGMMRQGGVQVDVPVAVRGLGPDVEVIPDAVSLTFQRADGRIWSTGPYGYAAIAKQAPGQGDALLNADVDLPQEFFDGAVRQRVGLKAVYYLTLFGSGQASTIAAQSTPVPVSGGLQCWLGAFHMLTCASMYRWPNRIVYAQFGGGLVPFTRAISYSPFPAGMNLYSFEVRQVSSTPGAQKVTIVQKEVLAHLRQEFVVEDFPLRRMSVEIRGTSRRE
ncbi:hypothetical protein [Paludibaculum fermentans]|uniref:hypothetical protein n=1 Tax=Paludibaculum fermentans TaxID=1473598 RepID=UPI003EBB7240